MYQIHADIIKKTPIHYYYISHKKKAKTLLFLG